MKVNRKEVCLVLESLKPGLANREILEQSTHFIFDRNRIYTFNDQIMVTQHYKTKVKGTVEGQTLLKVLQKIPDEEITLREGEGELLIAGKKRKVGLKMIPKIALDIPFDIKDEEWFRLPTDFAQGIKLCMFSTSRDTTKGSLVCIQCKGDRLTSCDNYRLTSYKMEKKFKFTFLLPRSAAEHLVAHEPVTFTSTDAWLHFQNDGGGTLSCRTMGEDYPDVTHLFEFDGEPVALPDGFQDNVERAGLLSTAEFNYDRKITISLKDDKIICKGEGDEGWIVEEGDIRYKGKEIEFDVHPTLLHDILKHVNKVKIGEEKLLFRSSSFQHVVALSG